MVTLAVSLIYTVSALRYDTIR